MDDLDRRLAPIYRRLNMMVAVAELLGTDDSGPIQTMQLGVLADETADVVNRLQTYGLSATPPAGETDALVVYVGGYRDKGHVIGLNHRGSRPTGLRPGEVALYNDHEIELRLTLDGDLTMDVLRDLVIEAQRDALVRAEQDVAIRAERNVTIEAGEAIRIEAGTRIDLNAPQGVFVNGVKIPGTPP